MSLETAKALREAIDAHFASVYEEADRVYAVSDWVVAVELSALIDLEDDEGNPQTVVGTGNDYVSNPERGANSTVGLAHWLLDELAHTVRVGSGSYDMEVD